jgi:hypothetical protein
MDALPHSQKRQQQWQQSKDLAFAAAASTHNRESVTKESAEEWMLYLTARRDSNSGSNRRT